MDQPTHETPKVVCFNLNNEVEVTLSDRGIEIWKAFWKPHDSSGVMAAKVSKDGVLREQLWHIMEVFGPHIRGVADSPIMPTEIRFEVQK